MTETTIKDYKLFGNELEGIRLFSGDKVSIIGEQILVQVDGTELPQYLYHIAGFSTINGKPNVGLKENIVLC